MKKTIVCLVCLVSLLLGLSSKAQADIRRTVHVVWSYDTPPTDLAGFRIYNNGEQKCEIMDPAARTYECEILFLDGQNSLIMTAFDLSGQESAPSDPFLLDPPPASLDTVTWKLTGSN